MANEDVTHEFEGDLQRAVFWGADLRGATFRDVDLTGTRISHAWVVDVEIDALVDRLTINGVDVTDYVNEHDPWFPLRAQLRPADPAGMRSTWEALQAAWAVTLDAATELAEPALHERAGGEWSLVETLRHLRFAMDKWFTAPVLGGGFDPIGLPNTGSLDFPWPDLDREASPSFEEAIAVRQSSVARFAEYLASVDAGDLDRTVDVLENGPHPTRECVYTVFEEEFWHLRYARRDLTTLGASGLDGGNR